MDEGLRAEIVRMADAGLSYTEIARRAGVGYWQVYANFRRKNRKRFRLLRTNAEKRAAIVAELMKMRSYASIARIYQLHRSSVMRIARADAKEAEARERLEEDLAKRIDPEIQIQQLRRARRCPTCNARVTTSPCVACLARDSGKSQQG